MRNKIIGAIVLLIMCGSFFWATSLLPAIGDADSAPNTHVSDYYIENSKEDTAANNIVSGTLADYRGYDTMFETSVMFISGLVVTLILVRNHHDKKKNDDE